MTCNNLHAEHMVVIIYRLLIDLSMYVRLAQSQHIWCYAMDWVSISFALQPPKTPQNEFGG